MLCNGEDCLGDFAYSPQDNSSHVLFYFGFNCWIFSREKVVFPLLPYRFQKNPSNRKTWSFPCFSVEWHQVSPFQAKCGGFIITIESFTMAISILEPTETTKTITKSVVIAIDMKNNTINITSRVIRNTYSRLTFYYGRLSAGHGLILFRF